MTVISRQQEFQVTFVIFAVLYFLEVSRQDLQLFFKKKGYLFTYILFLPVLGLCSCTRAFSSCSEWSCSSLWCAGFSLWWLLLLQSTVLGAWASVVVARGLSSCGSQALECRLSSCGERAQLLRGMWDIPRPGLEPVSPALAGGFLTTAPPGKPGSIAFTK